MSNSPLICYTQISPNRTSPRNHKIDTITIHCFVGQVTVERGCEVFARKSRRASCNYVVAKDGKIGLVCPESDRSWCSSNSTNDNRAITIEVASDTVHPYAVTDAAMDALINLCADICKRNDIKELKWKGDKNLIGKVDQQNMTVHRWFANKACPGDYLYNRHSEIAAKVNKILNGEDTPIPTPTPVPDPVPQSYKVRVTVNALNIRKGPGTNYPIVGCITDKGVYTIIEEKDGFGRLKSGAGWICLQYTKKI